MNRNSAREIAVQLVFACANGKRSAEELTNEFFEKEYFTSLAEEDALFAQSPDKKQTEYITKLVNTVADNKESIDAYIEKYAMGWKPGRISKTALAVLRCAIAEILYFDNIPTSVSINEAVELAKGYDEPDTVAFINGVLGGFIRGEFPVDEAAQSES